MDVTTTVLVTIKVLERSVGSIQSASVVGKEHVLELCEFFFNEGFKSNFDAWGSRRERLGLGQLDFPLFRISHYTI